MARSNNTLFTGREGILHDLEILTRDDVKDSSPREKCRVILTGDPAAVLATRVCNGTDNKSPFTVIIMLSLLSSISGAFVSVC